MLYYFKKGKNATETQKKICAVYGEGAVTDYTCQTWFVKFHAGDFWLDDAPQLGRPVEVDSKQTETLIKNNRHYAMQETAVILKISKSTKLLVKMKNVSFILWEKPYGLFGQPNLFSAWHRICTQMSAVINYCPFCLLSLTKFQSIVYLSLNFFTFHLVLHPLNSNFCSHYTTEMRTAVAEFTLFYFSAACSTFDHFNLKPSPWLVKRHVPAAHL